MFFLNCFCLVFKQIDLYLKNIILFLYRDKVLNKYLKKTHSWFKKNGITTVWRIMSLINNALQLWIKRDQSIEIIGIITLLFAVAIHNF